MKNLYNKISLFSVLALVAFEPQNLQATSHNHGTEELQDSQKPMKSQTSESFELIKYALQRIKIDQFVPFAISTGIRENSLKEMKHLALQIMPDDDMFDTWISLIINTFPKHPDFKNVLETAQKRNQSEMAPAALNNLGVMYQYGYSIEQDFIKAFKCYEKAANQGFVDAQYNFGFMYRHGKGVDTNYTKAIEYYKKAADQGHMKALHGLGIMYKSGYGADQNFTEAKKCYEKAIKQGSARAYLNLGNLYKLGHGVDQDSTKAIECYEKAANQGVEDAQFKLGLIYQEGTMIEKDLAQSLKWFLMCLKNKSKIEDVKNDIESLVTFVPLTITTEEEAIFKANKKKQKNNIKFYLGLHGMERGVNNPTLSFNESEFAIPILFKAYQEMIDFEDVLLKSIPAFDQSSFMVTCLQPNDIGAFKSSHCLDIKYYELQGEVFLTFGQDNIKIADNVMKVFDQNLPVYTTITYILNVLTEIQNSLDADIAMSDLAQKLKAQYISRLEKKSKNLDSNMTQSSPGEDTLKTIVTQEIKILKKLLAVPQKFQGLLIEDAPIRNKLFLQNNEHIQRIFKD